MCRVGRFAVIAVGMLRPRCDSLLARMPCQSGPDQVAAPEDDRRAERTGEAERQHDRGRRGAEGLRGDESDVLEGVPSSSQWGAPKSAPNSSQTKAMVTRP